MPLCSWAWGCKSHGVPRRLRSMLLPRADLHGCPPRPWPHRGLSRHLKSDFLRDHEHGHRSAVGFLSVPGSPVRWYAAPLDPGQRSHPGPCGDWDRARGVAQVPCDVCVVWICDPGMVIRVPWSVTCVWSGCVTRV